MKMETQVLAPPIIYLDTCHLIQIARLRKGAEIPENSEDAYKRLDDCLRQKHFGVVFYPSAALEWVDGDATLDTAFELADIIETASLQYEIESDFHVYLYEVLKELKRISPNLSVPDFEVWGVRQRGSGLKRPIPVLLKKVPAYFEEGLARGLVSEEGVALPDYIPFDSVREFVKSAHNFKQNKPDVYQERVEGHKSAVSKDLHTFGTRKDKTIQVHDRNDWIKRYLKVELICTSLNEDVDLDELLRKIDFSRCPAASLFLKSHEKRLKAGIEANDNDGDDWAFLHVFPYSDLVLTERQLSHFVRQADAEYEKKVTHDPNRAIEILEPWL